MKELAQIRIDFLNGNRLGDIYEALIPPEVRHDLGQYYTPPSVCDLLVEWAIQRDTDCVLDPSCGSGGFLASAYERIGALNPELIHKEILDRLHGIEINRFPAHLTAMNLALKDLASHTNFLNVTVKDFFDEAAVDSIGSSKLDAIIGNPPYVRQELIPNKDHCRKHLGKDAALLDARSDMYVYFVTKSLKMLKEGGRLAFIVSNRWLQTGYGERFQSYLLGSCHPTAIVSLDKNVFDDALIGTVMIFLEKKSGSTTMPVKFIRLKSRMARPRILDLLKEENNERREVHKDYNVSRVPVSELITDSLWRAHLYAPDEYFLLSTSNALVPMSALAVPEFGIKTGANDFFYLKKPDMQAFGLNELYGKPLLKSVGQLPATDFGKRDTDLFVLDLHRFAIVALKKAGLPPTGGALTRPERVKLLKTLKDMGHGNLAGYIAAAEERGHHEIKSVANRRVWWSLGPLRSAPYAFTKECWREFRTPVLADSVPLVKKLDC